MGLAEAEGSAMAAVFGESLSAPFPALPVKWRYSLRPPAITRSFEVLLLRGTSWRDG